MPDIFIEKMLYKSKLRGLTEAGINWIKEKLAIRADEDTVTIDTEHLSDIVDLIENDGLSIQERK